MRWGRGCQCLAIEIFRVSRNLSPPIMNDIFTKKDNSRKLKTLFENKNKLWNVQPKYQ